MNRSTQSSVRGPVSGQSRCSDCDMRSSARLNSKNRHAAAHVPDGAKDAEVDAVLVHHAPAARPLGAAEEVQPVVYGDHLDLGADLVRRRHGGAVMVAQPAEELAELGQEHPLGEHRGVPLDGDDPAIANGHKALQVNDMHADVVVSAGLRHESAIPVIARALD